jgi:hypothetical protein
MIARIMVNPFEPPRTDLEGVAASSDAGALPEPALRELVGSAPWARWTARLALVSIVLGIVNAVVTMLKAKSAIEVGSQVGSLVVSVPVGIVFLVLFRRYAARATELEKGEGRALADVIDAQRSLYKTMGIVTIVMIVMIGLVTVLGIVVGLLAAGRQR